MVETWCLDDGSGSILALRDENLTLAGYGWQIDQELASRTVDR